ncbi:MAG: hypothetical protein KDB82_11525, partial [Planctomycetes bacterium]|nr:hypothetical protein [Planctomycetota bacterium]
MKLEDNNEPESKRPGPPGRKTKGIPVFMIALAAMVLLLVLVAVFEMGGASEELDASQLRAKLQKNEVKSLEVRMPESGNVVYIKGKYESVPEGKPEQFSAKIDSHQWEVWLKQHEEAINKGEASKSLLSDVEIKTEEVNDNLGWFLKNIIPILIIVAVIWFFFFRRGGGPLGGGVMSFGKSRAKMFSKEDVSVTFNDVAGADEAKEEVAEIVEFLRTPQRFTRLGAKIPKGVLMIGPPGCGKTLLAKA